MTLDVMMPGVDGWAVLTELKADPRTADIPVIILSILDDKNLGFALGATDYLTKPIDRERLITILERYHENGNARHALVIEDDAATREMLGRMLEKEGWSVNRAANGRIALEKLRELVPQLILLDLMMPEMDGFEFVTELRQHPEWRGVPIIVVTAKDLTPEDRLRLNGYVVKILQKSGNSRDELLAQVRDLVKVLADKREPRGTIRTP
jgi:CheY-like chemotaxis protein